MSENKKVRFIRVRGRIVPIKMKDTDNKKRVKAAAKITGAVGVTALATKLASKDIGKSFFSFNKSSDFAAMRKLTKRYSTKRNELIKQSAAFRVVGRKFSKKGNLKLNIGIGIASLLAGSGITDIVKSSTKNKTAESLSDEVGAAVSSVLALGAVSLIGKKFKVKAKTMDGLTSSLQRKGAILSAKKLRDIKSTGLGVKERSRLSKLLQGRIFRMKNK